MPSLKDILILIFVLFGCLVITLFSYKQPVSENLQQAKTSKAILSETSYQVKALIWNETKDLEERTNNQPQNNEENQNESRSPEPIQNNSQQAKESDEIIRNPETILSLETILAEVENLASELKLEFENIQKQKESCPSCIESNQTDNSAETDQEENKCIAGNVDAESDFCKEVCARREAEIKNENTQAGLFLPFIMFVRTALAFDPCMACGPCACLCHCCGPVCCI